MPACLATPFWLMSWAFIRSHSACGSTRAVRAGATSAGPSRAASILACSLGIMFLCPRDTCMRWP